MGMEQRRLRNQTELSNVCWVWKLIYRTCIFTLFLAFISFANPAKVWVSDTLVRILPIDKHLYQCIPKRKFFIIAEQNLDSLTLRFVDIHGEKSKLSAQLNGRVHTNIVHWEKIFVAKNHGLQKDSMSLWNLQISDTLTLSQYRLYPDSPQDARHELVNTWKELDYSIKNNSVRKLVLFALCATFVGFILGVLV